MLRNYDLNVRHIIFVASFLSSPAPVLARLAAALPIQSFASIPFLAPLAFKALFFGWNARPETISLFQSAIKTVDPKVLRMRLCQISKYKPAGAITRIDATYMRPVDDMLVNDRTPEFKQAFPNLTIVEVPGPHFLLQVNPEVCAKAILTTIEQITR